MNGNANKSLTSNVLCKERQGCSLFVHGMLAKAYPTGTMVNIVVLTINLDKSMTYMLGGVMTTHKLLDNLIPVMLDGLVNVIPTSTIRMISQALSVTLVCYYNVYVDHGNIVTQIG